ncbi:extracellular signal-regulated kinase 2 isoform X1 [Trichogramma pretiosum]|uniref:extracellular signal-regulated kinase 2 isoform X1 n=1 Tax=Trichogramma pretiosum TaxID=7493 RepID=UPI0006C9586F|nr:extracellular signal-regulated kinase 2 isoform X1 [Trichogramma pretiosum]
MSGKRQADKHSEIDVHVTKHYDIIRRLGKGAYGIVWKAINKRSKETVAVKKIFDAFRNQTDAQRTFREIIFLISFVKHENIIKLIDLHKANNDRDIYLVFEYMETDLHNVIKRGTILKDIHKVFIMYQLFKAIKYIHSGNVIHRDLKPSNILLNTQCHCKIADFGLARSVCQLNESDGEFGSDPTLTDYVATRWYRAPEILIASKRYTKGIDMWSLGCILGEMLLGKPLFPGSSTINQVERIMATLPTPTEEEIFLDLLSISAGYGTSLLEKTPATPHKSLNDLLPGISNKALDLISNLIVFNPNQRLTAIEALEHPYVASFHVKENEPEKGSSVIPFLRDDVQLSVEEYRNKLYSMMDQKSRRHKSSKSRSKYSTELMKTDYCNFKQCGDSRKKSFHLSCDDIRKDKSKSDTLKALFLEGETKYISNNDSCGIHGKESKVKYSSTPSMKHLPQNMSVQYAYNTMNSNYKGFGRNQVKSCSYLSHQQHPQNKSQRSVQSDKHDYGASLLIHQPSQLRRSYGNNIISSSVTKNQLDYRPKSSFSNRQIVSVEKVSSQYKDYSSQNTNYHYKKMQDARNHSSMPESANTYNDAVSRKYLQRQKKSVEKKSDNHYGSTENVCGKNALHFGNNVMNKTNNDSRLSKNIGNYSQNHSVISASAYRKLKNSTIGW